MVCRCQALPPSLTLHHSLQPREAPAPAPHRPLGPPGPGLDRDLPPPAASAPSSAAAFGLGVGGAGQARGQARPPPSEAQCPLTFFLLHLPQVVSTHQGHTLGGALSLGRPHLQLEVLLPLSEGQLLRGGGGPRHGGLWG